jgi:quinoprotein dehydrogenase-associated probable ABC transporter substrate-binding protein
MITQAAFPLNPRAVRWTASMVAAVGSVVAATAALATDTPKADLVNRKELRVCSDPADLPFSNDKKEGFENKIADIIADELKLPVVYTWYPKSSGFIRRTLFAKRCDLVIGWGQGDELVLNTNHIYRSVSVLIVKPGTGLDDVESLADPRLKDKAIGVIAGAPTGDYLARNGLMGKARPYQLVVDRRYASPGEEMVKDIRSGEIDAGVHWGPIGAYWAKQGGEPLKVIPLLKDTGQVKLHYRITMGVRQGDDNWKKELNKVIAKRQGDIDKVLLDYGMPLLVDNDQSMDMITAPRPNGGEAPPEPEASKKPAASTVPMPNSAEMAR